MTKPVHIFWSPRNIALATTIAFTALRCILAGTIGLGVDESYALMLARELHLSYFDHPPLHFWIAHFAESIFGETRWVRLPFIALSAGTSWLMYLLTSRLFSERAGAWAVFIFNLTAFFSVAAGGWVLPDGPLDFCLLAGALFLVPLTTQEPTKRDPNWLMVGLWFGLAGLSKYHAAVTAAGFAAFLLTSSTTRRYLRQPGPYIASLVAIAVVSPVAIWNAQHNWASFLFQGSRASPSGLLHFDQLGAQIAGEIGYLLPWIFVPLVMAAWDARKSWRGDERVRLLLWLSLPNIILLTLAPLWSSRGLPHWPMPGWLLLFPLLGKYLASHDSARWPWRWAAISAVLFLCSAALVASDASTGWVGAQFPALFKRGDPTLETMEWTGLNDALTARAILPRRNQFVLAANWRDAAKIDLALGKRFPVYLVCSDARGFAYRDLPGPKPGDDAIIVQVSTPTEIHFTQYFASIATLPQAKLGRNGRDEVAFDLHYGKNFRIPPQQTSCN